MRPQYAARLKTPPSLYLGQVATNCKACTHVNGGISATMTRTLHRATDDIKSLQVVLSNWYWVLFNGSPPPVSKTEQGSGNTVTFSASIEYPVGTFTQILFAGSATSASIASGSNAISDFVSVNIPMGATFYVREFAQWAGSTIVFIANYNTGSSIFEPTNNTVNLNGNGSTGGEGMIYTGATDLTMSGTFTPTTTGNNAPIRRPLAILAYTRRPSVAITGNSIGQGLIDKFDSDDSIGFGRFLSHLSPPVGFIDLCGEGETVGNQVSNFAKRGALIQYCSHVWHEGGVNDLTAAVSNASADTVQGYLTGAGGLFPTYCADKRVFQTTIIPPTTSSNNWTAANGSDQTIDGNNTQLELFNVRVRGGLPSPVVGCIDFAAILEIGTSGKRLCNGVAFGYQADSVHPTRAAMLLARDTPLITTATFAR